MGRIFVVLAMCLVTVAAQADERIERFTEWGNRTYYEILGITNPMQASASDIKTAYRKKAMSFHPDRNPGDVASEHEFKAVNAANEVLSDAQKRQRYDSGIQKLQTQPSANPRAQNEADRRRTRNATLNQWDQDTLDELTTIARTHGASSPEAIKRAVAALERIRHWRESSVNQQYRDQFYALLGHSIRRYTLDHEFPLVFAELFTRAGSTLLLRQREASGRAQFLQILEHLKSYLSWAKQNPELAETMATADHARRIIGAALESQRCEDFF